MEVTVSIRRAVMEDELLPSIRLLALARIEVQFFPELKKLRLFFGQARFHGEVCLGKIYR